MAKRKRAPEQPAKRRPAERQISASPSPTCDTAADAILIASEWADERRWSQLNQILSVVPDSCVGEMIEIARQLQQESYWDAQNDHWLEEVRALRHDGPAREYTVWGERKKRFEPLVRLLNWCRDNTPEMPVWLPRRDRDRVYLSHEMADLFARVEVGLQKLANKKLSRKRKALLAAEAALGPLRALRKWLESN